MDQLPSFRMESLSLSLEEQSGLIAKGEFRDPLFARTLNTSADLISLTKIGLGHWEEEWNFPKWNKSLTDSGNKVPGSIPLAFFFTGRTFTQGLKITVEKHAGNLGVGESIAQKAASWCLVLNPALCI